MNHSTIIGLIIILIFNTLFLKIYCIIEAKIENQYKNAHESNSASDKNSQNSKKGTIIIKLKSVYKYLDRYMYGWMRYCIICTGKIPSNRIRKLLYKYIFGVHLTKKTVINSGCEIRSPWNVKLGNCVIAGNCILDGRSGIEVHDNVVFGMNVHIWTQEHDINSPDFAVNSAHKGKVVIKSRAWICSDTTIMPGVIVEEGAVTAAKSCVIKNCLPYKVYGGVPAKIIAERTDNLTYELSGKPHWHFW